MMKVYKYKIQWVFPYGFGDERRDFKKLIRILSIKSFDYINFLDEDFKIIGNYDSMNLYKFEIANKEFIKYLEKYILPKFRKFKYIEVVRK